MAVAQVTIPQDAQGDGDVEYVNATFAGNGSKMLNTGVLGEYVWRKHDGPITRHRARPFEMLTVASNDATPNFPRSCTDFPFPLVNAVFQRLLYLLPRHGGRVRAHRH